MSALMPYAFKQEAEAGDLTSTDSYQWIKFRVFDLTLEHLERQGLDAERWRPERLRPRRHRRSGGSRWRRHRRRHAQFGRWHRLDQGTQELEISCRQLIHGQPGQRRWWW